MVTNSQIIKKIYFPRLIIPISAILVSLIDFMVAFVVFIIMMIYYGLSVNIMQLIFIWPLAIIFTVIGTLGPSCWLAALNVKYRDFRYLIPFLIQALLFLTPIIYPVSISKYPLLNYILAMNPLYGTIMIFRIPFSSTIPEWHLIITSLCSSILLIFIGVFYFRKTESYFADLA
jgi:lipopolysaccharide transport system permease protein